MTEQYDQDKGSLVGRGFVGSERPLPTQNHILAALPTWEYQRLLPHLEFCELQPDSMINGDFEPEGYLYFLVSGIAAKTSLTRNGEPSGIAIVGSEGVLGVATILGGNSLPTQAAMLQFGCAYRLRADLIGRNQEGGGELLRLLLSYTMALIVQIGQSAACNRHHSVEQQLSRLILSCADRLPSTTIDLTQELMADTLGVRREGVTAAAGQLRDAGLIRYARGRIDVLDRPRLEAGACECYAVVNHEYTRLLHPQISAGIAGARNLLRH